MLVVRLRGCPVRRLRRPWLRESRGEQPSHIIPPAAYAAARATGHAGNAHGRSEAKAAQDFVKHFSAQTTETSTYLYNLFRPPFSSNATSATASADSDSSSNAALAYTVTKFTAEKLYRYLFSTDNAKHLSLSPLSDGDDENIVYAQYVQSARKQLGGGVLGLDVKYAAWRLIWRGVVMDLYVTSWIEAVYTPRSQTHIVVRSLPPGHDTFLSSLSPAPASLSSSSTLAAQRSLADQAASLFLLELGDWTSSVKDAILVFEDSRWREDSNLWKNVQKADWEDVILDSGMKEGLKHEYRSFFKSEKVYKDLGVAWKRGIIFLGPPGNGKTITLKAMMKDAGVPILYVKTFHTYGGDELGIRMVFERARQEAPCLLIFEDLDSLITENNRSFMLNEVDGLEDNDGMLMIGTTNHFDKLDPALSSRPSRFDRKYLFPNPTADERTAYATYWRNKLSSNPRIEFPHSLIQTFAEASHGFSFAYMKEVFVSTLLLLAGDEKHTLVFETVLLEQVAVLRKELERGDADGKDDAVRAKAKQEQRMFGMQSAMGGIGPRAAFRIG